MGFLRAKPLGGWVAREGGAFPGPPEAPWLPEPLHQRVQLLGQLVLLVGAAGSHAGDEIVEFFGGGQKLTIGAGTVDIRLSVGLGLGSLGRNGRRGRCSCGNMETLPP